MCKIVYLIRHSENVKNDKMLNRDLSLTDLGKEKAKKLSLNKEFENIDEVWSSTYKRAIQTASFFGKNSVNISSSFDERLLGKTEDIMFWEKQMKNENIKGIDGESQKEVRKRMFNKLKDILKGKSKRIIIVSHGAAITFLLLKWCDLKDAFYVDKRRHITFMGNDILNGKLFMPDVFKLTFDGDICKNIERIII